MAQDGCQEVAWAGSGGFSHLLHHSAQPSQSHSYGDARRANQGALRPVGGGVGRVSAARSRPRLWCCAYEGRGARGARPAVCTRLGALAAAPAASRAPLAAGLTLARLARLLLHLRSL